MLLNNLVAGQYAICAICEAHYSTCKNYVLCVPECVVNDSISVPNGNMEGVDTLTGTGILNFLNIYIQQTPINAPHYSLDNSRFWCRVSSVVHKQFLSKLSNCMPNPYWRVLLVS